MILGFKEKFPWGTPTYFVEKIERGAGIYNAECPTNMIKIHTLRGENCRIKPGDTLHMATGVRTANYKQFNKDIPQLQKCISVQNIQMELSESGGGFILDVYVDGRLLDASIVANLVANDGLEYPDFLQWFWFRLRPGIVTGKIIHWTNLKY